MFLKSNLWEAANWRFEFYGMFQNSFRKNFGKNFETNLRCLIMNEHELCYRKNDMRTKNCQTPFLSDETP